MDEPVKENEELALMTIILYLDSENMLPSWLKIKRFINNNEGLEFLKFDLSDDAPDSAFELPLELMKSDDGTWTDKIDESAFLSSGEAGDVDENELLMTLRSNPALAKYLAVLEDAAL